MSAVLSLPCQHCKTITHHRFHDYHEEGHWVCVICCLPVEPQVVQELINKGSEAETWKKRALRAEATLEDDSRKDARKFAFGLRRWGGSGPNHFMRYRFR